MALNIIGVEERLKTSSKLNIALFGPSGIGKTTLARTLDPSNTLFVDLEAGMIALQDWPGDVIDVLSESKRLNIHPWEFCRGLAVWLGGPNPAMNDGPYSQAAYNDVCAALGDPDEILSKYDTIFVDSITVASRHSFGWAQQQPAAFSEKTGKPDTRGAYGLHGLEMVEWLTSLQHQPKSIIVVGILDAKKDDFERTIYEPQIVGGKVSRELPGIFDQVMTLQSFDTEDGGTYRALVCHQINPWGYPAKDRTGLLDLQEQPDLGKLLLKVSKGGKPSVIDTSFSAQPTPEKGN